MVLKKCADENFYNAIEQLVKDLNYYTEMYDKGTPVISDSEWDRLYFLLVKLENSTNIYLPNSPTQSIQYRAVNELNKVEHNHLMLSLDKTKDWDSFANYFKDQEVVGMLKLDGLTCSLRYVNGKLVSAETRGNGRVGEDILHNTLVIKSIPNKISYYDELIIDGEIICTSQDFEKFASDYANPRNFAAGSIRLLNSKECASRDLTFVAWHAVKCPGRTVVERFEFLKSLGFKVVPYTLSLKQGVDDKFLLLEAEENGYPIDGLVGRFNDIEYGESLGTTDHHSRAAYAFKFSDEEYETWLTDIEWSMGRTGQITPIAIFNPVDTGDSIIERASLHNISIMKELLGTPYQGQTITIFKANDIIPQVLSSGIPEDRADIEGLKFSIPTKCPICGGDTEVVCDVDTEVLMCTNEMCEGKLINRLDHFCGKKGLDIKGLSKATLEKLVEWGWVSQPADLYKLNQYRDEWIDKSGFGQKSVDNILNAIENSRTPKLEAFISSLGIPLIGKTISKDLIEYVVSYEDFRDKAKSHWDFTIIEGIAWEKASAIWNFDFAEADAINEFMLGYQATEQPQEEETLKGVSICITGRLAKFKNRNELIAAIEARGGKVVSSVSRNTDYLINNDKESNSSKNVAAARLGVRIISEEDFFNSFLTF